MESLKEPSLRTALEGAQTGEPPTLTMALLLQTLSRKPELPD